MCCGLGQCYSDGSVGEDDAWLHFRIVKIRLLIVALSVIATPLGAVVSETTYTDMVVTWNGQIDNITKTLNLTEDDASMARQVALLWIYLGPCDGSVNDLGPNSGTPSQIVIGATERTSFEVAVLAMIGLLQSNGDLGRKVPEDVCKFALELANPRR